MPDSVQAMGAVTEDDRGRISLGLEIDLATVAASTDFHTPMADFAKEMVLSGGLTNSLAVIVRDNSGPVLRVTPNFETIRLNWEPVLY